MGVLTDAFLDQFGGDIDLRLQIGKFPLQFVRCESRSKCTLEDRDEPLCGTDDRVGGLKEQGFDLLFVQRGGGAFSTVELVVALPDGRPEVVPEEAAIVRDIYRMFLDGMTIRNIAKELTERRIKTPGGKDVWSVSTIRSILSNEKYKGDALLQKTYTLDYLTKTVKKNKGEVKQYYVTNSHEAIIDEDVFNLVQVELQRRSSMRRGLRNNSPFCTKLVCGDCGSFYGHKIFHAKEKHSKDVWYCNRRYQGSNNCSTPILAEGDLIRYYLQALSEILADKDRYISACKAQMDEANALEKIRFKREKAEVALAKDMAKIQALVRENAYISQDQQVYRQRFEEMSEQIEKQKNTIAELQEQELRLVGVREKLYRFIEALESFDAEPTFDSVTWNALVERVLVNPKSLIFEFKNGEKIKITI